MKITVMMSPDITQFNLTPESEHEKEMIGVMAKYNGDTYMTQGVQISECRGAYLRDFGPDTRSLAITLRRLGKQQP